MRFEVIFKSKKDFSTILKEFGKSHLVEFTDAEALTMVFKFLDLYDATQFLTPLDLFIRGYKKI
jgi:hypothetical protein